MRFLILFIFIYLMTFQVKANEPDLTMFDTSLQRDIKNACITIKYNDGLVPYFECLEKNKKEIIEYGKRPDLSMFDISLQRDIKNTCNTIKYNDGIIPYFDCVSEEKTKLEKYFNPEDASQDELEDTEKLKLYLTGHVCNLDQPIEFLKEKALNFYNEEKYEDTFKCSLAGALLNDPYSNGILGWHYQFGIGIEENLSEANFWYEKGVILDDNYSKVNLAKNFSEGIGLPVDKTRAFQLVKEAAETGYDVAEAELGFYYLESIGTPANYDEAFKYFKLAAEKGNVFAQGYLGWMYAGGRGTEIDYDLGFYWTKKAADKFDVFSLANLGWHYENGFGVTMNISEAKRYYELASSENNEFAMQRLKEIKKNQYENQSLQSNISFQCNKIKNEKNFSTKLNSETPNTIEITYDPSNNELLNYVWDKESIVDNYHTVEFSSITKILEIWEKDSQYSDQDKYFFEMYGDYIAHLYKLYIPGIDYQCKVIDNNQLVLSKIDTKNLILEPIEEDYVSIKSTYFRSEPTPESNKLEKLEGGEVVYVVGKINNYYKVEINEEKYGFIFHKLLTPFAPTNNQSQLSENIIDKLDVGSYFALVIGNNKYHNWPRLETAVNDASKIGQILSSKYNFKVTSLIDANRDEIMNAIFAMRENLKENDNLLIYFAGHGELDEEADRGYWVPVDGDIKNPTKWISNQYIIDQLKASKAKHIMVIADSCFSASLLRGNQKVNTSNSLNQLSKMKTRVILTSGGLGPVFDGGGENNHSVFASVLINALLNQNKPFVTGEIFPQIREYVQNNVDALFVCDDNGNCEEDYQTPEFSVIGKTGHEGGDFIFVPN